MNSLSPTVERLLNVALNKGALEGEATTYFLQARKMLLADGIDSTRKLAAAVQLPAVTVTETPIGSEHHWPFGKYRDATIRDVWFSDRPYAKWFRQIDPESNERYADEIREVQDIIDQLSREARR